MLLLLFITMTSSWAFFDRNATVYRPLLQCVTCNVSVTQYFYGGMPWCSNTTTSGLNAATPRCTADGFTGPATPSLTMHILPGTNLTMGSTLLSAESANSMCMVSYNSNMSSSSLSMNGTMFRPHPDDDRERQAAGRRSSLLPANDAVVVSEVAFDGLRLNQIIAGPSFYGASQVMLDGVSIRGMSIQHPRSNGTLWVHNVAIRNVSLTDGFQFFSSGQTSEKARAFEQCSSYQDVVVYPPLSGRTRNPNSETLIEGVTFEDVMPAVSAPNVTAAPLFDIVGNVTIRNCVFNRIRNFVTMRDSTNQSFLTITDTKFIAPMMYFPDGAYLLHVTPNARIRNVTIYLVTSRVIIPNSLFGGAWDAYTFSNVTIMGGIINVCGIIGAFPPGVRCILYNDDMWFWNPAFQYGCQARTANGSTADYSQIRCDAPSSLVPASNTTSNSDPTTPPTSPVPNVTLPITASSSPSKAAPLRTDASTTTRVFAGLSIAGATVLLVVGGGSGGIASTILPAVLWLIDSTWRVSLYAVSWTSTFRDGTYHTWGLHRILEGTVGWRISRIVSRINLSGGRVRNRIHTVDGCDVRVKCDRHAMLANSVHRGHAASRAVDCSRHRRGPACCGGASLLSNKKICKGKQPGIYVIAALLAAVQTPVWWATAVAACILGNSSTEG
jgi:hypothetical protein